MRIDRLIVIAGASACGKSRLMTRLRQGLEQELCKKLQMGAPASWHFLVARNPRLPAGSHHEQVVMHYDLMRPVVLAGLETDVDPFENDPALELITAAGEVTYVSLRVPAGVLLRRNRERRAELIRSLFRRKDRPSRGMKKLLQLNRKIRLLRNGQSVTDLFQLWMEHCSRQPSWAHWILTLEPEGQRLRAAVPAAPSGS